MRTMAMRHSALLAWRSPPAFRRRWPAVFPEPAGMGATPHRWAQAASECSRPGLSPAATRRAAAVSGPTPKRAISSGAVAKSSVVILSSRSPSSASRTWTRWANEHSAALVAAVTGSGALLARRSAHSATKAVTVRPFRRERSSSGAVNTRWRIWTMAFTRAWRAERLATTSTRMASTPPSLDLHAPAARPLMTARAASTASRGSDLPWLRRAWRFGRLTSTTSTPLRRRNRASPTPYEPVQQRLVAGGIGVEGLGADEATQRIEGCGYVRVEVGVDATRDANGSFY